MCTSNAVILLHLIVYNTLTNTVKKIKILVIKFIVIRIVFIKTLSFDSNFPNVGLVISDSLETDILTIRIRIGDWQTIGIVFD